MEEIVRKEFGIDESVNMQVSNTLSQLTEGETPLLSKSDLRWIIQDSQYNIVIKIMLVKRKIELLKDNKEIHIKQAEVLILLLLLLAYIFELW